MGRVQELDQMVVGRNWEEIMLKIQGRDSFFSLSAFLSSEARSARSTAFFVSSDSVGRVQGLDKKVISGN